MTALHTCPGSTSVQVAEALRRGYAHLVHLERTGYVRNRGADVNRWHALRDAGPQLG